MPLSSKDYTESGTNTAIKILPGVAAKGGTYTYNGAELTGAKNQFQAQAAAAKLAGFDPNPYNVQMGNRKATNPGSTDVAPSTPSGGGRPATSGNSAPRAPGSTAAAADTAYVRSVDPSTETAAGQLAKIQNSNSDLMRLAKRQGLETKAKQGLLSSSLAAGAAQNSMLERSVPLAQQDAGAYLKQAETNQNTINQFRSNTQQGNINQDQSRLESDLATGRMETEFGLQGDQKRLSASLDESMAKLQSNLDVERMRDEYIRKGDFEKMSVEERAKADRELTKSEYDLKAAQLAQEFGYTMQETGGKQNAALAAQYLQGAAEINTSNMSIEEKRKQIQNLREMTLSAQAATAMGFGDQEMQDFYETQMETVVKAAADVADTADTADTADVAVDPGRPGFLLPEPAPWVR